MSVTLPSVAVMRPERCQPEYCAYELAKLPKPVEEFEHSTFRSAGGHIHLGVGEDSTLRSSDYGTFMVIRCMDLFLGIPSLFMDQDPTSPRRKELYGLAGSHRYKPYGVEYRALGNFWLASPKLVGVVYDVSEFVVDFHERGKHLDFWEVDQESIDNDERVADCIRPRLYDPDQLRAAFNTGDKAAAQHFLSIAKQHMPKGLYADVHATFNPVTYNFYQEWSL